MSPGPVCRCWKGIVLQQANLCDYQRRSSGPIHSFLILEANLWNTPSDASHKPGLPRLPSLKRTASLHLRIVCFLHKNLRIFFSPLNLYSKKLPHPWLQIAPPMVFKRLRDGSKGVPFDEFSPTCWASKPTNFRRFSMEISDFSRASSSTRTMLSATFLRAWGDERNSKFRTETTGGKQKDG